VSSTIPPLLTVFPIRRISSTPRTHDNAQEPLASARGVVIDPPLGSLVPVQTGSISMIQKFFDRMKITGNDPKDGRCHDDGPCG
jgi:hypothetical protein